MKGFWKFRLDRFPTLKSSWETMIKKHKTTTIKLVLNN